MELLVFEDEFNWLLFVFGDYEFVEVVVMLNSLIVCIIEDNYLEVVECEFILKVGGGCGRFVNVEICGVFVNVLVIVISFSGVVDGNV